MGNKTTAVQEQAAAMHYGPDSQPPFSVCIPLGIQIILGCVASIIASPTVMVNATNITATHGLWCIFSSLLICGSMTALMSIRWGRIGSGYQMVVGSYSAFLAIAVLALKQGGPPLLATLTIVAALVQFFLGTKLAQLRRIITPTVAGTMLMLVSIGVVQVVFTQLGRPAPNGSPLPSIVSGITTSLTMVIISTLSKGSMRFFVAVIGIVVGCLVYGMFSTYDLSTIATSAWIGVPPVARWPGISLSFGGAFWSLLPPFIIVSFIGLTKVTSDIVSIQKISWRKPREVDFKEVQGGVAVNSLSCLLSGLFGTVPNITYSSSMYMIEATGNSARRVGVCTGVVLAGIAFSPKLLALLLAIPASVAGGCLLVIITTPFVAGMRMIVREGLNAQKSLLVGIPLWVCFSVGFQEVDMSASLWNIALSNSITAGGVTAILLATILKLSTPRPQRLRTELAMASLPAFNDFLSNTTASHGWEDKSIARLHSVSEEVMLILTARNKKDERKRNLLLTVEANSKQVTMEFIAADVGDENIYDQMTLLNDQDKHPTAEDLPLLILDKMAYSVRHYKYHNTDIITVLVVA